ncbi:MAG: NADH-quinone oxidoreductase subunit B [Actinomycetia bacterium]|nr:NADH-quinone oxidoreductase subunit B [Actinomycetes bacterium]
MPEHPARLTQVTCYTLASDPTICVRILNASLACCTLELQSAISNGEFVESDDESCDSQVTVLVVAGTVTDALVPSVMQLIQAHPGAKVMSFGACATSGGPYWDSPPVSKGIDQFVDVHTYVAGCPPRPEAFIQAVRELAQIGTQA